MTRGEQRIADALVRCQAALDAHERGRLVTLRIYPAADYPRSHKIGTALAYYIGTEVRDLAVPPRKASNVGGYAGSVREAERLFHEGLAALVQAKRGRDERKARRGA